ncbi:MAG: response regulator [Candidatus Omnitrophica bacterium]|nr:response regulator [Candidatus Omnitrophota bacterium]
MEDEGYYVKTAISKDEAVEEVSTERYDIVHVDLVLPYADGVAVCKEVKKRSPDTEVVLFSGHPKKLARHRSDFLNAGGRNEILRKPLDGEEIISITEKILKEKKR